MAILRITKEFQFEGAHALSHYDGKCRNIHGHSYKLFITISGRPLEQAKNPKNGMVLDFSLLKEIVNRDIISIFDHALVLQKGASLAKELASQYNNVIELPFQPTCENLTLHFVEIIKEKLPHPLTLQSIKLHETASSYVEWVAQDNL
ncbi:MAG: 6-carboxytetrahydropterin synthase [Bacteroidales bacterium]